MIHEQFVKDASMSVIHYSV